MPGTNQGGGVLSARALNRAFLARQMVLDWAALPALEAVRRLYALQAQSPNAPYPALHARLEGFRPEELGELLGGRRVVRMALMRSTIHLLAAEDALALRPLVQPVIDRGLRATYGRALEGIDPADLETAARALLAERPRTFAELGEALAARWPERDGRALGAAVRAAVPLAQLPPRGVWGSSGAATHAAVEEWLGRPVDAAPSPAEMTRRYLAAFGPASVADLQSWTGLTKLKPVVEALRPELRSFRDEHGRELFDLPEAPRPDPATPAPPRLLGEFDNLVLGHADRTRVLADAHKATVFTVNGIVRPTVLLDGLIAGCWRVERTPGEAVVVVEPFAPVPPADRTALEADALRMLTLLAPAERHGVRVP